MTSSKVLNIENARIGFRNFEGREGQYNRKGERSFAVFLDHQVATDLMNEGWNVKFPKVNERIIPEEDDRNPYLIITVAFDNFPPNVHLISNEVPSRIGEQEVAMLDWAEISNVDLVIRPYHWNVNGNSGVKAYLKSGYFTIVTDAFAHKYGI